MGLSVREVEAVLAWVGVDRCYQAVWNWKEKLAETQSDPPTAAPSRVAVDEKQIEVDGEKKWLYAAIDTDSKLLLEVDVYSRRGTDPAALTRATLSFAHQKSPISEDGVSPPPHRETRRFRDGVSRRCWRLPDCPCSSRIERSAQLYHPKPHRKVVSNGDDADRPLSLVLAGQSSKRETVAPAVQTLLQPLSTEPGIRRRNSCRGGAELDSAVNHC